MASDANPYAPPGQQPEPPAKPLARSESPVAIFRSTMTEGWMGHAMDRWAHSMERHAPRVELAIVLVLTVIAVFWFRSTSIGQMIWIVVNCIVSCALVVMLHRYVVRSGTNISKKASLKSFRNSPECGKVCNFTLYHDRLAVHSETHDSVQRWSFYKSVIEFPDGFLLIVEARQMHWLFLADLVAGEGGQIAMVLKTNIRDYRVITR